MIERSPKKPGPKPDTMKVAGDWEQAVSKALKKKRPADWQKKTKKPKK